MNKDPLRQIDALCGNSDVTRELRAGIAAFALEQAKFHFRIQDPTWVDRAIEAPDWARTQLRRCRSAAEHGIRTMESQIAPFCEEVAKTNAEEAGINLNQIKLRMKITWTSLKEVGTLAIAQHIATLKKEPPSGGSYSLPSLKEGGTSIQVEFSR